MPGTLKIKIKFKKKKKKAFKEVFPVLTHGFLAWDMKCSGQLGAWH